MIYKIIISIFVFIFFLYININCLHLFQLKNYEILPYLKCILKTPKLIFSKKNKTPLVFTDRAMRYYLLSCFLFLFLLNFDLFFIKNSSFFITFCIILVCFSCVFIPFLSVFLHFYEQKIKQNYINLAKNKLKNYSNLITIGITGSVGKTSTKNILNHMLKDKFKTTITPKNYNTPFGLTKTILDEMKPDTQVLILEMGARHIGDIKELCDIVQVDFSAITNISMSHIETFRSIENIAKTKAEIINGTKNTCVLNIDNKFIYDIYKNIKKPKISISVNDISQKNMFTYDEISISNSSEKNCAKYIIKNANETVQNTIIDENFNTDYYAKNIKLSVEGLSFDVVHKNENYHFETKLLGKHNITNILISFALANAIDFDPYYYAAKTVTLPQIKHRLEVIKTQLYTIIDDTYNASQDSIKSALEVLSEFSGRKIIVSPGIIEGGDSQYKLNFDFGRCASAVCNIFIIVNKVNFVAISDGLISGGFDKNNIIFEPDLESAKNNFSKILKKDDILMLINDLPNDYI